MEVRPWESENGGGGGSQRRDMWIKRNLIELEKGRRMRLKRRSGVGAAKAKEAWRGRGVVSVGGTRVTRPSWGLGPEVTRKAFISFTTALRKPLPWFLCGCARLGGSP